MDVTKLKCNASYITGSLHKVSTPCSSLNDVLKIKPNVSHTGTQISYKPDALEAVKLDPAVLEAQVTFTPKENDKEGSDHASEQFIEDEDQGLDEATPAMSSATSFEHVVSMQEAALQSLTPQQMELLLIFADSLRKKRFAVNKFLECAFCKNNGESVAWYKAHALKDGRGRVLCPVLRGFRCPRCGATGDRAHTIKYCPKNINLGNF